MTARKGMRAAPLPRCTVTGVTAVVSVPRVLGTARRKEFLLHHQLLLLWALGSAWVRTSFEVDR